MLSIFLLTLMGVLSRPPTTLAKNFRVGRSVFNMKVMLHCGCHCRAGGITVQLLFRTCGFTVGIAVMVALQ